MTQAKCRYSFKVSMADGSVRSFIKDKTYRCVERSNGNIVMMDESRLGVEFRYHDFIMSFDPVAG